MALGRGPILNLSIALHVASEPSSHTVNKRRETEGSVRENLGTLTLVKLGLRRPTQCKGATRLAAYLGSAIPFSRFSNDLTWGE